ncbi:MAG: DoxX family membrane protein [Proteobacteria bacterium]|nr:DoxX family membrane protein [Pseudomonadota bacterium]
MSGRWPYLIGRLLLAGVFIWAGAAKLADPKSFAGVIEAYGLLPGFLVWPTALGLPLVEILAGIGLVLDVRFSLEVIVGLLLMFIVVLWVGMVKGLEGDCGCRLFELVPEKSLRGAIHRDLMFIGLALFLYWCRFWRFWVVRASRVWPENDGLGPTMERR